MWRVCLSRTFRGSPRLSLFAWRRTKGFGRNTRKAGRGGDRKGGKTNEADRLAKADARKRYTHVETIFRVYLVAMRFAFLALTHSVFGQKRKGETKNGKASVRLRGGSRARRRSALSGDPDLARLDTLEAKLSSLRFAPESSGRRDGRPRSMAGHFEIYRSVAYWQHVNTLLDVEGSMSRDAYVRNYGKMLVARFDQLLRSRRQQVDDAIAAVCAEWQASVVMDAAGDGDEGALHRLHADGCDMGQAADDGHTPAHKAALNGHGGSLRLLHEWGCNMEQADNDGGTSAHMAALNGHEGCLSRLGAGSALRAW